MKTYRITATNDKTGKRTICCPGPLTHAEACIALKKFSRHPSRRIHLEETEPPAGPTAAGKIPTTLNQP